jgi:predicted RecB family nuclease
MPSKSPSLSKSRFCAGKQCLKRLYWLSHPPGEFVPKTDPTVESILRQGQDVGALAQRRYPGGVLVEEDYTRQAEAEAKTRRLLADPSVPAIYEAAFTHEGVRIRVDVLERIAGGAWRMIEVKSSTAVRAYHLDDVAIQTWVLRGCGVDVRESCLLHIDRGYVYAGGDYDLETLFACESLDGETDPLQSSIPEELDKQRRVLQEAQPPIIEAGPQCTEPYTCEFWDLCNEDPPADWVGILPGARGKKLQAFAERGIERIGEIPADFPLTERQRFALESIRAGEPRFRPGLRDVLERLPWPRLYMDFETVFPALPRFSGMRPYDQLPFQWSVHTQAGPGAPVEHAEFLATTPGDPREAFLSSLLDALGTEGPIIVYNAQFEDQRLVELAGACPQYRNRVAAVRERLWDLLPVMRAYVYHPAFRGSYSLKSVLPAFVPAMAYDGLDIAAGDHAGLAYERLIHDDMPPEERARLVTALKTYCGQDTLGLLRLIEGLMERTAP